MIKIIYFSAFLMLVLPGCSGNADQLKTENVEQRGTIVEKLNINNLLRDSLELAEGIEVIMSYVEVPKETTLPFHYHPGEEFAYIIEGSGQLLLKDKTQKMMKAGDAGKVPLKHVHSFSTLHEGAKMVVFRVHEKGQPDRILIE